MARRRHDQQLSERHDAAAGHGLQRDRRERARRIGVGAAAASVLGLAADVEGQPGRVLPDDTGDQPAVWPARGGAHARGRRTGERVRAPQALRGSDASRGCRMGSRAVGRMSPRIQQRADGGRDARGPRCRRAPQGDPGAIRHVARGRARQVERTGFPHRPPRRLQRPDAGRHARRRGDGSRRRRSTLHARRHHCGARLSRPPCR